jgi:hypothetical protein
MGIVCYNKNCLYNIRAEEKCGFEEDSVSKIYIDSEGKCAWEKLS